MTGTAKTLAERARGTWFLHSRGRDGLGLLTVGEGQAEAEDLLKKRKTTATFEIGAVEGGYAQVKVALGEQEGELHVLLDGDEAQGWVADGRELFHARRVIDTPPSLLGEWTLAAPRKGGARADTVLAIADGEVTYKRRGHEEPLRLLVLAQRGGGWPIVMVRRSGEGWMATFKPLPGVGFLVWERDKEEVQIAYAAGSQPSWLELRDEEEPEPTPSLIPEG